MHEYSSSVRDTSVVNVLLFIFGLTIPLDNYSIAYGLSIADVLILSLICIGITRSSNIILDYKLQSIWGLLLILEVLSCIFSSSVLISIQGVYTRVMQGLVLFVIISWYSSYKRVKYILAGLVCGGVATAILTVGIGLTDIDVPWKIKKVRSGSLLGVDSEVRRVVGFKMSMGSFGQLITTVIFILFSWSYLSRYRLVKLLCYTFISISFISIIVTQSRSTIVAVIVSGLIYFLYSFDKASKYVYLSIAGLIALTYSGSIINSIREVLFQGIARHGVQQRIYQYYVSIGVISDNFVNGIGRYSYKSFYSLYDIHLHNTYLSEYVSLGFIGGTLFIILAMVVLNRYRKVAAIITRKRTAITWVGLALFAGFVANLIEANFHNAFADKLFWLLVAISYSFNRDIDEPVQVG